MYPRRRWLCRQGRRHRQTTASLRLGSSQVVALGRVCSATGESPGAPAAPAHWRPRPDSQRCSTTPAPPVRVILIGSLLHATRPYGPRPRVKILVGASLISSQYFHS